jgi:hypothetical protein
VKLCLSENKLCPKSKVKVTVLNRSDEVRFRAVGRQLSLVEVGWRCGKTNHAWTVHAELSMNLEQVWFFVNSSVLGTTYLWTVTGG